MQVWKCDWCGDVIDDSKEKSTIQICTFWNSAGPKDLCRECYSQLANVRSYRQLKNKTLSS